VSEQLFEQWKQTPQDVELLHRWVALMQEQSQQGLAIEQLEHCIEQPEKMISATVYVALVNLSMDLGDLSRADNFVNRLHSLLPDSYQPYFFKGRILAHMNRTGEARKAFKEAIKRQRDNKECWFALIDGTAQNGDFNEALGYINEARKLAWPPRVRRLWIYKQACIFQRLANYSLALVSFSELILDCVEHGIPAKREKTPRLSQVPPSAPLAALKEAITLLEGQGLQAFPTAGTLLGWWREGAFLAHDKDIDIMLPVGSDWQKAVATLSGSSAFRLIPSELGFSNFISLLHIETGMVVDVSHHEEDGDGQAKCVWRIPGLADEQCRRTQQSAYRLVRDEWLGCEFWRPEDPDQFLTELYGDWRTPMKTFDTVISGHHLVGYPDAVRCYAYNRLANSLSEGSIEKGMSYVSQILQKDPLDPVANRVVNVIARRKGGGDTDES